MKIELTGEYHEDCNKLMERIKKLESNQDKIFEAWEASFETGLDEPLDRILQKIRDEQ